jgi:hypothetical protein
LGFDETLTRMRRREWLVHVSILEGSREFSYDDNGPKIQLQNLYRL